MSCAVLPIAPYGCSMRTKNRLMQLEMRILFEHDELTYEDV